MTPRKRKEKTIVGWSELIDFPEWGISGLRVKVDTGARTSALHVENMLLLEDGRVQFDVILDEDHSVPSRTVEADVVRWGRVRSSTGHFTKRCFVKAHIRLGGIEKSIELSLVSREKMVYRMILGRRALAHDFLVDVSRRHILTPHKKKDHGTVK